MRKLLIITALAFTSLTACKKSLVNQVTPTPETVVTEFKQIKAADNFDWKTAKSCSLNVKGMPTAVPIVNTLTVTNATHSEIYYTGLQQMDQDALLEFELPGHITEIVVSYGSINKKLTRSSNSFDFNYVTEIPE